MRDSDLRSALKRKVLARQVKDPDTIILDEFPLGHAPGRIDLVVVNSELHGFEFKSDSDSLIRLPDQARMFSSVFDRVTLVVGYRHAFEALQIVPDWWGVKLAHMGPRGAVHFADARSPRSNPCIDPRATAKLLRREEALHLLQEMDCSNGWRSKSREAICDHIAEASDLHLLRQTVRSRLKARVTH